jgi:hypothetical protein
MSEQSTEIGELAAALAAAQGEITGALKDSKNPFFKSSYADLASVWDACRVSLSKNGLAVIQTASTSDAGAAVITTTLAHKSGQWIRGTLAMMPVKSDPQGMGSALTYARRYALAAMVGVAQVDDDANNASGKVTHTKADPLGRDELNINGDHAKYANDLRLALEANATDAVKAISADLQEEGEEFYRAVWSLLDSKQRSEIKKILAAK